MRLNEPYEKQKMISPEIKKFHHLINLQNKNSVSSQCDGCRQIHPKKSAKSVKIKISGV
jgi:cytidine deaminase